MRRSPGRWLLIDDPINRYRINSPVLPELNKDADCSITVYPRGN